MQVLVNEKLKPKDSEEEIIYAEERLTAEVQFVINAIMKEKGIKKSAIAEALGVSSPTISRMLDESANLTLRTIARIFYALEDKALFTSKLFEKMADEGKVKSICMSYKIHNADEFVSPYVQNILHKEVFRKNTKSTVFIGTLSCEENFTWNLHSSKNNYEKVVVEDMSTGRVELLHQPFSDCLTAIQ